MPQQSTPGIDVSVEEERYLRRAFRRFALPYVLIFGAVAWIATTVVSSDDPATPPEGPSELKAELAALKQTVAALDDRIGQVGTDLDKARRRMAALESQRPGGAPAGQLSVLERDLREATRRVAALERRAPDGAPTGERIDALSARMRRLEDALRQAPQTAPAPAAPSAAPAY